MISASELCKDPSFWTLAKPHLAEAIVPMLVILGFILLFGLFAAVASFFNDGAGI